MIVHIVMFQFKDEKKSENLAKVKILLEELVDKIPTLLTMEVGINFNQSDRAFDLVLYSTFNSINDLKSYAVHPAHLDVVKVIKELSIESKVVDYEK